MGRVNPRLRQHVRDDDRAGGGAGTTRLHARHVLSGGPRHGPQGLRPRSVLARPADARTLPPRAGATTPPPGPSKPSSSSTTTGCEIASRSSRRPRASRRSSAACTRSTRTFRRSSTTRRAWQRDDGDRQESGRRDRRGCQAKAEAGPLRNLLDGKYDRAGRSTCSRIARTARIPGGTSLLGTKPGTASGPPETVPGVDDLTKPVGTRSRSRAPRLPDSRRARGHRRKTARAQHPDRAARQADARLEGEEFGVLVGSGRCNSSAMR